MQLSVKVLDSSPNPAKATSKQTNKHSRMVVSSPIGFQIAAGVTEYQLKRELAKDLIKDI